MVACRKFGLCSSHSYGVISFGQINYLFLKGYITIFNVALKTKTLKLVDTDYSKIMVHFCLNLF